MSNENGEFLSVIPGERAWPGSLSLVPGVLKEHELFFHFDSNLKSIKDDAQEDSSDSK